MSWALRNTLYASAFVIIPYIYILFAAAGLLVVSFATLFFSQIHYTTTKQKGKIPDLDSCDLGKYFPADHVVFLF